MGRERNGETGTGKERGRRKCRGGRKVVHIFDSHPTIEEGLKQKTRQNVVVLDWGSRSNAALGNFGVKV